MQCEVCRTRKHDSLKEYGGLQLCANCYDKYNPPAEIVHLLSEDTVKQLERAKDGFARVMRAIEHKLHLNDLVKASGQSSITVSHPSIAWERAQQAKTSNNAGIDDPTLLP